MLRIGIALAAVSVLALVVVQLLRSRRRSNETSQVIPTASESGIVPQPQPQPVKPIVSDSQANTRRIAMLIDGDNVSASRVNAILEETAKHGRVTVRRVYGDWSSLHLRNWSPHIEEHALHPIQQFARVTGKNATDMALIIDAMDLLHNEAVDGFCIVSSDSDFASLATRIRNSGLFVMGIGKRDTPMSLQQACDQFIFLELLGKALPTVPSPMYAPTDQPVDDANVGSRPVTDDFDKQNGERAPSFGTDDSASWEARVERAIQISENRDPNGFVNLADVGNSLLTLDPAFDSRIHGRSSLSQLIRTRSDRFELRYLGARGSGMGLYIRSLSTADQPAADEAAADQGNTAAG